MVTVLRVYNSGDRRESKVDPEFLIQWIEYNCKYRFGCALFVNGWNIRLGMLDHDRCYEIEKELRAGK